MAKVTIEQDNVVAKQGENYLILIQKKNWPKITPMLHRKLHVEITMSTIED